MRKPVLTLCIAAGLILATPNAFAGTRVYVSLGFPACGFVVNGYDCCCSGCCDEVCDGEIWIEGHYCTGHRSHIWVPGYWAPAAHNHAMCLRRPAVHHHFHCNSCRDGYRPAPQKSNSRYRDQGHGRHDYRPDGRQSPGSGHGQGYSDDNGRGHSTRQQAAPSPGYDSRGRGGHRPDGNWMNTINNTLIKRQVRQTSRP